MTTLSSYAEKYRILKMERNDGILVATLHTNDGPLQWGADDDDEVNLADAFADIAADPENRVVILTGTGDSFCDQSIPGHSPRYHNPETFEAAFRFERLVHMNFLSIEVPVIAALNGPTRIHSEIPLMSDIVLAADTTVFQDKPHFPAGIPPGDGMHIVWPLLIGHVRARYFMLTGQEISAEEAFSLGVVNEVLRPDQLMGRALELARMIAARPPLSVRYTRRVLNLHLRRLMEADLEPGLALEGLAISQLRGWRMHLGGEAPVWDTPEWARTE